MGEGAGEIAKLNKSVVSVADVVMVAKLVSVRVGVAVLGIAVRVVAGRTEGVPVGTSVSVPVRVAVGDATVDVALGLAEGVPVGVRGVLVAVGMAAEVCVAVAVLVASAPAAA